MADGTRGGSNDAALPLIATDDAGAAGQVQIIKLALSADGSAAPITADAGGLLVNLGANNDVTVTGSVTANAGTNLNTSALATQATLATIDADTSALAGTVAGSELQVDVLTLPAITGTGTFAVQADTELTTADLDTGAGSDVRAVVGLVGSKSGGGQLLPGDATAGLKVDLGSDNDVTVTSGAITATLVAGGDVDILTIAAGDTNIGNGDIVTMPNVVVGSGTLTAVTSITNAVTVDSELMAAAALADAASATPTTPSVGAVPLLMNATTVDRQRAVIAALDSVGTGIAAAGIVGQFDDTSTAAVTENQFAPVRISTRRALLVEGVASGTAVPISAASLPSHAVTNAGTFAVQIDAGAVTSLALIDDPVFADEAAYTVASSKVMASGVHSVLSGSAPDTAAVDAAVNPVANRNRVPFVIGGDPGIITLKHTTITTAVTDAAIVTVTTPNKIVVTRISVTLDNASTVFPTLLIGFGAANTPTTTGVLVAHGGVPAGGGITVGDGSGILGIGADAEDLRVTTTGNATGNGLQIVVTYYLVAS